MSGPKKATVALLDLWRPPRNAGDPIGCLASTYSFAPSLFDEQCLARFLEIESDADREDLAFLLERETRLGGVYAGVLVDYTQAGVEHSLRWDVLPVRIPHGKQHAKLSLLAWSRHVRLVVASANLTEQGYRANFEVVAVVDFTPTDAAIDLFAEAAEFLETLIRCVPGSSDRPPEITRARAFLARVRQKVRGWEPAKRSTVRQELALTLPALGEAQEGRSSLVEAVEACRRRGGSPAKAWVASPFFDVGDESGKAVSALCKLLARSGRRDLRVCVPAVRDDDSRVPRLAAPRALWSIPPKYDASVEVRILPDVEDKNRRPWHAKMLALRSSGYVAVMIGSSNFTCAGLGIGERRHAEANLITIAERGDYGREAGELKAFWPSTDLVEDPDAAEWLGAQPDEDEEAPATKVPVPEGFLSATYRAGERRQIILRFEPSVLPPEWSIGACSRAERGIVASTVWVEDGRPRSLALAWEPPEPPEKLVVRWSGYEAFMPLNVEDERELPPPPQLQRMSADDMLSILAATDPSAAFRVWARRQEAPGRHDDDPDSAAPIDLDPLRRYDLGATFLHRVGRRAKVLARLRANLERPVWGRQQLEWRLRGLVGVEALADRLMRELAEADGSADEALLVLADFLVVLGELDYRPSGGGLPRVEFDKVFRPFLAQLAVKLSAGTKGAEARHSPEVLGFWRRVVQRHQQ